MTSMTDHMTSIREFELGLLAAGVVGPMTMPARRPARTWTPPAGQRAAARPARPPARQSPVNAHMRRVRGRADNGWWHEQQNAALAAELRAILWMG